MRNRAIPFVTGVLFGVGLLLSGMTDPSKVLGFLDVTGRWDPSLAFVMIGAIGVHAMALRWLRKRRARPLYGQSFHETAKRGVDAPLVAGSILFGIGWGLAGLCPGPALVSLGTGSIPSVVFFIAMALGSLIASHALHGKETFAPTDSREKA